jgi:hypothetical protein
MSGDVRVEIQDHKGKVAAMQHKVFFIKLSMAGDTAEDALVSL